MTDPIPALDPTEAALVAQTGQWSGLYLPLQDARVPLAYALEEKGLITIDRHQEGQIYVALVNPSTPAPMPGLMVLPKPDPKAVIDPKVAAWGADTVDPRDAQIADLEAENAVLKKKVAALKRKLDLEEGFGDFMEGKARREE